MEIRQVLTEDDPALKGVEALFTRMYDEMKGQGLVITPPGNSSHLWLKGISKTLGRLSVLFVALSGGEVKGFAHGSLRFLPDYLGGHLTGNITHIYIVPDLRGSGAARELHGELENWFSGKQVHSVDLQVIPGNEKGIEFWERLGYRKELLQYRKIVK